MAEEQKRLLERQLWNIADTLRGKMDADEFRDYILGFIFYKYLSEKMQIYADKILREDGIKYHDIDENSEEGREFLEAVKEESLLKLGYFLKPSELFGEIAKRGNNTAEGESNFILEELTQILNHIEQSTMGTESEDDFNKLFEDLDDFRLSDSDADVLGDAYEYRIGQFASGAGKKAGEFYTPQQVSKTLAKIVTLGKTKLKHVYDPTCGSGSLLLRVQRELKQKGGEVFYFYGQELNRTTYNLARMNMILHDVHFAKFDIRQEDTLEHPQHTGMQFEAVVANPPFSAKWSASPLFMNDDRFSQYGKLAPGSKADFAFVQHMIHHLDENGTMAVVLPHGVLFRGAAEGHIRRYLIEDRNYLDAVIGLPANIFYGTSIPTCILVLKKCREQPGDILFIDAGRYFEKGKNQNSLRDEDVQRIIDTYEKRQTIDKYSYAAPLSEVRENDFNLNIPRYVDTFEQEEPVDIEAVATELGELESEMTETDNTIADFCKQLNISTPF
jgi:type I restriction enzyme M protein